MEEDTFGRVFTHHPLKIAETDVCSASQAEGCSKLEPIDTAQADEGGNRGSRDEQSISPKSEIDVRSCVTVDMLMAKGRLSPIKPVSTPRLELLAIVLGTRMVEFVRTELKQPSMKVYVWSDPKCALYWIHSQRLMTVFVENQLRKIRRHQGLEFRYAPTELNPADIPSRGCCVGTAAKHNEVAGSSLSAREQWPEN